MKKYVILVFALSLQVSVFSIFILPFAPFLFAIYNFLIYFIFKGVNFQPIHESRANSHESVLQEIIKLRSKVNDNGNSAELLLRSIQAKNIKDLDDQYPALIEAVEINTKLVIRDVDTIQHQLQESGNHHIIEKCISYAGINLVGKNIRFGMEDQLATSKAQESKYSDLRVSDIFTARNSLGDLETLLDQCNGVEPGTEEACYSSVSAAVNERADAAISTMLSNLLDGEKFSNTIVPYTIFSLVSNFKAGTVLLCDEYDKIRLCVDQSTYLFPVKQQREVRTCAALFVEM